MNKRKYLNDAYTWAFDATVENVLENGGVMLNHTYFYPEGGGQPSDGGRIGDFPLLDVQLLEGEVVHTIDGTLKIGDTVHCVIDGKKRLGYMQQHTAQHLISAYAYTMFSAHTVGLHISDTYFTVDFDVKLTTKDIDKLMAEVSTAIINGFEIKAFFVEPDKLDQYPLRKPPKVSENIRVVEIEGIDFSPCGGTHLVNTRELGTCLVQKIENYKSGVRLTIKAGLYAGELLHDYHQVLTDISKTFAIMPLETLAYTQKLATLVDDYKRKVDEMSLKLIEGDIDKALKDVDDAEAIYYFELFNETYPMALLREKVQLITEKVPSVVIAISAAEDKRHFVLAKSKGILPELKMGELFKSHFSSIGIKGGGSPLMAQGGCDLKLDYNEALETLDSIIQKAIQNAQ